MNPTIACDLAFLHVHARFEAMRRAAGESRLRHQVHQTNTPTTALTALPSRSHLLGGVDAEQAEPVGQRASRHVAQRQPARPELVARRLEHRTVLVERREVSGQLEEIRAQPVRAVADG